MANFYENVNFKKSVCAYEIFHNFFPNLSIVPKKIHSSAKRIIIFVQTQLRTSCVYIILFNNNICNTAVYPQQYGTFLFFILKKQYY